MSICECSHVQSSLLSCKPSDCNLFLNILSAISHLNLIRIQLLSLIGKSYDKSELCFKQSLESTWSLPTIADLKRYKHKVS